jgi:hypothetical protein
MNKLFFSPIMKLNNKQLEDKDVLIYKTTINYNKGKNNRELKKSLLLK